MGFFFLFNLGGMSEVHVLYFFSHKQFQNYYLLVVCKIISQDCQSSMIWILKPSQALGNSNVYHRRKQPKVRSQSPPSCYTFALGSCYADIFKQKAFKTKPRKSKRTILVLQSVTLLKKFPDQTKYCSFCLPVNALPQTPVLKKAWGIRAYIWILSLILLQK